VPDSDKAGTAVQMPGGSVVGGDFKNDGGEAAPAGFGDERTQQCPSNAAAAEFRYYAER